MTRFYWNNHIRENIITHNSHIACLIINSFNQPEYDLSYYKPYRIWKEYLQNNPKKKP